MAHVPPVRRQVVVPAGAEVAFAVFTDEIGSWWPVELGHSVYGAGAAVSVEDSGPQRQVVETGPEGGRAVWGTILDWEPPRRLRMTWHPGREPEVVTEVEVRFEQMAGEQTLVTLEHHGWERLSDPFGARRGYHEGWPTVLDRYVARTPGEPASSDETWLVLNHTPGAALAQGSSGPMAGSAGAVFAHPDFGEHLAFLRRLAGEGVLVAAGPVDPDRGEGMTVVRMKDAAGAAELTRRAQEEDLSVARELLQVRVRPWGVALAG